MENKRAYLVLGPESCGNRLVTRLLVAAGCYGNGVAGPQRLDSEAVRRKKLSPIVWLRSVPHGGKWPEIRNMVCELRKLDYYVRAIVPTREWSAVMSSQVKARHCRSREQSWNNLQRAYPYIFSALDDTNVPFVVLSYESLVQRPDEVFCHLLSMLKLPESQMTDTIVDGNAKWF